MTFPGTCVNWWAKAMQHRNPDRTPLQSGAALHHPVHANIQASKYINSQAAKGE